MYIRSFVEAVLKYTKADQIIIVSHSMGVTLSRRVIKGGWVRAAEEPYYVGESLSNKVHIFFALAGGNLGLFTCPHRSKAKICNMLDGYWAASPYSSDGPSYYLKELN